MRGVFKKYFGLIYVLVIAAAVMVILLSNDELGMIFEALSSLNLAWVWAAGGCIAIYLLLRMAQLRFYLARRGHRLTWLQAAQVTGAGQFYSAITPSASGGQPMQVLYLHRMGVPVSIGTACISVKFLGFQISYLFLGAVMALLRNDMIMNQLKGFLWLVAVGYVVNSALIAAVLLTIPKTKIIDRMIRFLVGIGVRLHFIKNGETAFSSVRNMLDDYREVLIQLLKSPVDALMMLALSLIQVTAYMWVAVCIYRAFGLSGTNPIDVFALQLMLFTAAAFIPLPGAAGAQESGFCVFFGGIFPETCLVPAMLCWRFFSYYLLLGSGLVLLLPGVKFRRKEI